MGLFDFFRQRHVPTAELARERLRIVIAQERSNRSSPDCLALMRSELIATIKKYTSLDNNDDGDFDDSLITPPSPSPRNTGGASASMKPAQPAY